MTTSLADRYERLFHDYVARLDGFYGQLDHLDGLDGSELDSGWELVGDVAFRAGLPRRDRHLYGVAQQIIDGLERGAASALGGGGARLDLDAHLVVEARRRCGLTDTPLDFDPSQFSPRVFWAELESVYGGDVGEHEALRQLADSVVRDFGLSPEQAPRRVKGAVCLSCRVFLDRIARKYGDPDQLDIQCAGALSDVCRRLAQVLEQLGYVGEARALRQAPVSEGFRQPVSRQRVVEGRVTLITYKSRYEFRLAEPIASEFQRFLTDYATAFQEAPA